MPVLMMPMPDVGNMEDNSTDDASAVAAVIAALVHHTMNTAIETSHVPLPDPCDQCKLQQHLTENIDR